MRVLIAEDDVLLRQGLSLLLEVEGFEMVGAAQDAETFLELFDRHRPDTAVIDVRLPPNFSDEGLRAAAEIRRRVPNMPVLVLSAHVDHEYAGELLGSGTNGVGYLLKDRVGEVSDFVEALTRVARGGVALDPEVVDQLIGGRPAGDPLGSLTDREHQVLDLMAQGHDNAGICSLLGLSTPAVSKHIGAIFGKLGLSGPGNGHRRVQAVLTYLRK
ncbi:response regulator transcription factor [Nocardiopsis sp. JB363]|uniref:response regulator transcription factor n=1 Tax=Nocardiopsis sp. JB363 TaxID=1434837 RepID=UPI00097B8520|nr:response regulator transcription factor [Nocardiopsis sp. JB363]SIO91343.1 putative two-component system response regulator [Nocardiopsis sp. JB363]